MLSDGAESQGREERQRRKDVDHEGHDDAEADVVGLQGADGLVHALLAQQRPGDGQLEHDGQVAAEEHGQTGSYVPEQGVVRQAFKT